MSSQDNDLYEPFGKHGIDIWIANGIDEYAKIVHHPSERGLALKLSWCEAPLDWTQDEVFAYAARPQGRWLLVFAKDGSGFCIDETGKQFALAWH